MNVIVKVEKKTAAMSSEAVTSQPVALLFTVIQYVLSFHCSWEWEWDLRQS